MNIQLRLDEEINKIEVEYVRSSDRLHGSPHFHEIAWCFYSLWVSTDLISLPLNSFLPLPMSRPTMVQFSRQLKLVVEDTVIEVPTCCRRE